MGVEVCKELCTVLYLSYMDIHNQYEKSSICGSSILYEWVSHSHDLNPELTAVTEPAFHFIRINDTFLNSATNNSSSSETNTVWHFAVGITCDCYVYP